MNVVRYLGVLGLITAIFAACQPDRDILLHGEWQAVSLTEQGDSLAVSLSDISFEFYPNGRYRYRSTLAYEESGTYRLEGPFLYSQDTLVRANEKAVEVLKLNADTLSLKMMNNEKERLLVLRKGK